MHIDSLNSFAAAVPLLLALVAGMLRVDEHLFTSAPRKKSERKRFAVADEGGLTVLTDPDGRPSGPAGTHSAPAGSPDQTRH